MPVNRITDSSLVERRQHIGLDLIAVGQRVGRVEQTDDRQHFAQRLSIKSVSDWQPCAS